MSGPNPYQPPREPKPHWPGWKAFLLRKLSRFFWFTCFVAALAGIASLAVAVLDPEERRLGLACALAAALASSASAIFARSVQRSEKWDWSAKLGIVLVFTALIIVLLLEKITVVNP
jgi:hypothetical protein